MSLSGVQITTRSTSGSAREAGGRGADRVVGLELDLRPEDDPERLDRLLRDRELGEERGIHPGRRLVAREQVVPERLDHVVRGAADVGRALLAEEVQDLVAEPGDARQDHAVAAEDRRPRRVVGAEQLVGRVDEVDLHRRWPSIRPSARCHGWQPASIIAPVARSPSPGWRSTAATASLEEERPVAEADRVEGGRVHAVVGREPADDDPLDPASPEQPVELGRGRLAGHRVAHREPGVAVLAVRALPDPRRVLGDLQRRDGARRPSVPATQWTGQIPPSFAKCGVDLGMPVLGVDDGRAGAARPSAISSLIRGMISSAPATDSEPRRIGEVVLHVDDHEGRPGVVPLHDPTISADRPAGLPAARRRPTRPASGWRGSAAL